MRDFPRRLLGLIVAESLLLSPCLWGDGVGGDDARPQVHGARGPILEREESLDAGEPLGEDLSETLEGREPWEGAVAGTALPVSSGGEDAEGYRGFGDGVEVPMGDFGDVRLNGSDTLGFSGNGQIGGYIGSVEINLGLAGSIGGSWNFSRVLTDVLDIDGDGIPELVRRDGSNLSGYNPINASRVELRNYGGHISKSSSGVMNFGARINLNYPGGNLAFGSFTYQMNRGSTRRMALDVDGDGFLDLVESGESSFGRNDGNGRIVRTRWAGDSFSIQEYQDDYFTEGEVVKIEANHLETWSCPCCLLPTPLPLSVPRPGPRPMPMHRPTPIILSSESRGMNVPLCIRGASIP